MCKLKIYTVFLFTFINVLLVFNGMSFADNAQVMPKGMHRAELQNKFWFPITQGYTSEGEKVDIGSAYTAPLDSNGIAALAALENAAGMSPGSATLGHTDIEMSFNYNDLILYYQYGVTDKLTVGTEIPYFWQWTDVKRATVNTDNATVGINLSGQGSPLLPIGAGGTANGDMAMEMLQGQLQQLGYQRIEDWDASGFGDIRAGFRYQYLQQNPYLLAVTGGVTIPTGAVDDPDSFVDIEFGEGAWGLFVHSNNDYTGISNLVLNLTLRYEHYLTGSQDRRMPESSASFLSARKESIRVQLGDKVECELSSTYNFSEAISMDLMYRFAYQADDSVAGATNYDYSVFSKDTFREEQVGRVGLSYSTIPAFKRDEFALPLVTSIEYRDRFAGKNVSVSRYIRLKVAIFF